MSQQALEARECPSASLVLERLLVSLPEERVSLGWLHEELHEHSFEMLAFVLALIGVLPGASVVVGLLMVVPAMGMMCAPGMRLPSVLAARSISARQASFVLGRAIALLRSWESNVRVSHSDLWQLARPLVGLLSLLLAMTLLVPIPLSNVIPALAIAGLSLACFEGNLFLLCISAIGAAASLGITCAAVVAASHAFASFSH